MFTSRIGTLLEQDYPIAALTRLPFERVLREFNGQSNQGIEGWIPAMDVEEIDDGFRVSMDLPGIAVQDIEVTIDDGLLSIKGERKSNEKQVEDGRVARYERHHGAFSRTFQLPKSVDPDQIEAECKHGVLTVKLHKREALQPRRIEVQ